MRKESRRKDSAWAVEVFRKAPYITLSMVRADGTPYAVPLNLVMKDDSTFYFHCAGEGEKIDCLRHNPVVWLSAVSRCTPKFEVDKGNFTEYYHSAMAIGKAEEVTSPLEKKEALRLLCMRFLPDYMEHFEDAISRSLQLTTIFRISLTEAAVGKSKPA